jgi:tetratricopeptide (TPR) repeat protein
MLGAALFGPEPTDEAIRRCERIMEEADSDRTRASAYRALGGLRAFRSEFDEARRLLEADHALIEQLGLRVAQAVAAEVWAMLGFLSGDAELAERALRGAVAVLEPIGEKSGLSTTTALLAEALYRQGAYDAALEQTVASESMAPQGDLAAQVQWRGARAKVLALRGEEGRAEALAREAVVLAAGTDFVNLHAGALADLATVLEAAGRPDEAVGRARSALALYRRKGNVAAVVELRKRFPGAG